MTVRITKWFMLVVTLVIVGWDVYVATNAAKGDTISEIQLSWAWDWPTIPFAWGVVVGHLFWPSATITYKWSRIVSLWMFAVIMLIWDVLWLQNVLPLIPLCAGTVVGHVLWPQLRRQDGASQASH